MATTPSSLTSKPDNRQGHFSPEIPSKPEAPKRSLSTEQAQRQESFTSDPPLTDSDNSLPTDNLPPSPSLTDSDSKLNEIKCSESPIMEPSSGQLWRDSQISTLQNGLKEVEALVEKS